MIIIFVDCMDIIVFNQPCYTCLYSIRVVSYDCGLAF